MYLRCEGDGNPTVVFESGFRNDADPWLDGGVFHAVSGITRACVYDRPGTLWDHDLARSDPVAMPRNATDVVSDLRTLLTAANEPGPYVLVGHSFGGLFVRLYRATHPEDVAGMVLVDATTEDQQDRLRAVTPDEFASVFDAFDKVPPELARSYPQVERVSFAPSQLETAEGAEPWRPMPLVVLTHGIPISEWGGFAPGFPAEAWEHVIQQLQRELAQLVPDSRHVVVPDGDHFLQLSRPDVVIAMSDSRVL